MSVKSIGSGKSSKRKSKTYKITAYFVPPVRSEPEEKVEITWRKVKQIGSGSFGIVYQGELLKVGTTTINTTTIAIKKVLQDQRYKNRELQVMRKLWHPNLVELQFYYYSNNDPKEELYLHLILDYLPYTLYQIIRVYHKKNKPMPIVWIKVLTAQLFRALAYMHRENFCHRDIKPQNILIDDHTGQLKLCDFGSAKNLNPKESSVAYICSRYYRAPELIFGSTKYDMKIDVWSTGCVVCEMVLGRPVFPGESSVDQLVEIIKVLGTPSKADIKAMNAEYSEFKFPVVKAIPWERILCTGNFQCGQEIVAFIEKIFVYPPNIRIAPFDALALPFYDSICSKEKGDPNQSIEKLNMSEGNAKQTIIIPKIFDFTNEEKKYISDRKKLLIDSCKIMNIIEERVNYANQKYDLRRTVVNN